MLDLFGPLIVMFLPGIIFNTAVGGVKGAANKIPSAIQSYLKYFAPQQALEKSIEAFSQVGSTAFSNFETQSKLFEQLKDANEADQNLKKTIIGAFEPFNDIEKYQKMQHVLTEQIDQKIAKRTELMAALHLKIKPTQTSGPLTRGQNWQRALVKRRR
jgi:hypothetical protein